MVDHDNIESALQADVENLRKRHPRTAELYREVCVVMFFRYGMTPTTNKLYQLVRKGSMSVPTEALRAFWADLRRAAKVNIEHAGLPEDLAQAAGELVAKLWVSAQGAAGKSFDELRQVALLERDAAIRETQSMREQIDAMGRELEQSQSRLDLALTEAAGLREEAAVAAAAAVGMTARLSEARQAAEEGSRRLEAIRVAHAEEIERITARIAQAEERYVAQEKRALVEIDRERMAAIRLEKLLDAERTSSAASIQRLQSELTHARIEAAQQASQLAAREDSLRGAIEERNIARDRTAELQAAASELAGQLAAERARAEVLREQLDRRPPPETPRTKATLQRKLRSARRSKTKPVA